MLLNVREYHRPADEMPAQVPTGRQSERLDEVIALLARPGIRTAVLAGGHTLGGSTDRSVEAVVDLQGLGLDQIQIKDEENPLRLEIGAMVTRAALAGIDCESLPDFGSLLELLAEAAHHWGGSVQRNRATVGGTVATAARDDPLVIALLACDASVALWGSNGPRELPLMAFLPRRAGILAEPAIITDLLITAPPLRTGTAMATVGRTPLDAPIVAAAAALTMQGDRCRMARLAIAGAGERPERAPEIEAMLLDSPLSDELIAAASGRVTELAQPAGDYRGSAEYRRAVAGTLSARALREAWERAK